VEAEQRQARVVLRGCGERAVPRTTAPERDMAFLNWALVDA